MSDAARSHDHHLDHEQHIKHTSAQFLAHLAFLCFGDASGFNLWLACLSIGVIRTIEFGLALCDAIELTCQLTSGENAVAARAASPMARDFCIFRSCARGCEPQNRL